MRAWYPSLRVNVRLRLTLFWYKPLFSYANHAWKILVSIRTLFFWDRSNGCIKTRSTPASFLSITVKWPIDWSTDWLIDWPTDWLIDWLTDGLIDWLIDWLSEWQIDWLIERLIDWLIDWLIDRLIDHQTWSVMKKSWEHYSRYIWICETENSYFFS